MPKLSILVSLAAMLPSAFAQSPGDSASNKYLVHNLVSDLPGLADHTDPNLVNPWGNGFGATPFWIGNNGTGTSTLYDGTGTAFSLIVGIPTAAGANTGGPVTGVIFNTFSSNTAAFDVAAGKPASFLFCSEDGLISGWNGGVDSTHAHVLFNNSASGAVYKGCALGGTSAAPLLFAANFNSGKIDVFDASLHPVTNANAFLNPVIPAGFAPFNVQNMNGNLYVTYAKQDDMKHDDVAGPGNGYVAVFDTAGTLLSNLIAQGALNSPWGLAGAPSTFGAFAGDLLVGNFGDGKINAYDWNTGALLGTLNDVEGNPIAMPGLWSLNFGSGSRSEDPGTLYFTAGIGGGPNNDPVESHGLLGTIQAAPSFATAMVLNGATLLPGPIAPYEWVTIKGSGLSATTATWQISGNTLPTQVAGVGVTVNGEAAAVSYVSNGQINFLVPPDIQSSTAQIVVTSNGLTSATLSVPVATIAPGFFIIGTNSTNGNDYIAATHADGSLIGPPGLITGLTMTPATKGETIVLFGGGFGLATSTIPNDQVITKALMLPSEPTIIIDGLPAVVQFAGVIGPGLYQFNVVVPAGVQSGDLLVVALPDNSVTQTNAFITVNAGLPAAQISGSPSH